MEIYFRTNKLEKNCNSYQNAVKVWGERSARRLVQRLNELRAAENLSVISHLPPARLHALEGDRLGTYAVDLVHPLRLVFRIDQEPLPHTQDGGVDRTQVTQIMILEVEDYHGKQKR
ncbi:hypothetical protein AXF19_08125 [Selenomonas sp. oral taxon 126]|nr:hypothetical protein AXF19_08125 [Selenomonas sp. oral taxon 126]